MKYFFGFLASIVLIIVVLILIIRGFSGGNTVQQDTPQELTRYALTNATVALTVAGPVVGDQDYRAYRITVGRSEVRIEALKGYQYQLLDSRTYQNNQEAYFSFLRAIDGAGFSQGAQSTAASGNDERGMCATGRRYIFEITSGTSNVQRYWATSCGKQGTFKGSISTNRSLFEHQVPSIDLSKIVSPLRLY